MMKRLAKSAALEKWNSLTVKIKSIENDLIRTKDEREIDVSRSSSTQNSCCIEPAYLKSLSSLVFLERESAY
jgi:hypothetical protein